MMNASYVLSTAPAREPMELSEIKEQLRIDHSAEDEALTKYMTAVRRKVERDNNLALLTQSWKLYLNRFPVGNCAIRIMKRPVQSITAIKYLDTDGNLITLAASAYTLDKDAFIPEIHPVYNTYWPAARYFTHSVEIEFVAGYSSNPLQIPEEVKLALKLLIGHYYENREDTVDAGQEVTPVPMGYQSLVSSERIRSL